MRHVIIGGGVAGTTAAEYLRKLDSTAEITIIELEPYRLYSRILLPFYIKGKIEREKVFLKKPEWYLEKNITLMKGVEVLEIDTRNRFVRTSEEREIPFDKLLITTGTEARLADYDMRGVSYLRTLDDSDHLVALLSEVMALPKKDRQCLVSGGGFISLEYINIFDHFKIDTTVIIRSDGFWSKLLSDHSKQVIKDHAEKNGVRVILNTSEFELLGEKELAGVKLPDGTEIPAKILGVGIGVYCDQKIFEKTKIDFGSGVTANEFLKTSVKNVYTAGDVAEFKDVIVGRTLRMPSWMTGQMQGRLIAETMLGEAKEYQQVSSYSAVIIGMNIVFIGDTSREHADEIIEHRATATTSVELFMRKGKMVGAVLIGDVTERTKITNAIKNQTTLS